MTPLETLAEQLHAALTHLYDPIYQPPAMLAAVLGLPAQPGVQALQRAMKQAIAHFAPATGTPAIARSRRLYDLLVYRYLEEVTQEETARRLGITPRHLRREQQQAITALAHQLWTTWQKTQTQAAPSPGPPAAAADADWRSQVRQEVALLQQNTPGAVTEVAAGLASMTKLGERLTTRQQVELQIAPLTAPLSVAIHPAAFRQLLLSAVEQLCQLMNSGQIVLSGQSVGEWLELTITGAPIAPTAQPVLDLELIAEIVSLHGGQVALAPTPASLAVTIRLPLAARCRVLVVDDNADLIHFYRRYTAQTRYEICQLTPDQPWLATVKALAPAIIVLDVMLPEGDGWELLAALREDPATQPIPVIICSVVHHAALAATLGAVSYLTKPVGRLEFIQALDQAYWPAGAKTQPA